MVQTLVLVITTLMVFILILFTVFLLHKGRRVYANLFLSLYLISQILGIFHSSILFLRDQLLPEYIHLYFIGFPFVFLWGVFYYFFIYSLLEPDFRIGKRDILHLIPFGVVFLYFLFSFYFYNPDHKLALLYQSEELSRAFEIFNAGFALQICAYNTAAIIQYLRYKKRLKDFMSAKPENDFWIKTALFGFLGACLVAQIGKSLGETEISFGQNEVTAIRFGVANIAFLLLYCVLFYLAISNQGIVMQPERKEKYWYSKLNAQEAKKISLQLDEYMLREKPYKKPGLTIKELASEAKIKERHLSQVINEVKKQNFFDFINSYRIEHAKQLLARNKLSRRTMLDILWDSGFNSKTAFNTVFKKVTGTTPSAFQNKE